MISIKRKTKETDISVKLEMNTPPGGSINTSVPFLDHMLYSMSFHGGFYLEITASGDTDVDPHHLVEDTGITIGSALEKARMDANGIMRFGERKIPMDDSLAEAVIDAGGRAWLEWRVEWAQEKAGDFDLFLLKDFFWGIASASKMNIHINVPYSHNGHHAAEAVFKAFGKALAQAYKPTGTGEKGMSTKGVI